MIGYLKDLGKTIIVAEHRLYYLKGIADTYVFMNEGRIIKKLSQDEVNKEHSKELMNMGLRAIDLKSIELPQKKISNIKKFNLEVCNISKVLDKKYILKDINLDFHSNEIIGLVGKNGTGKSTLGKIIAGVMKESCGNILLNKEKLKPKKRFESIWYIPQDLDTQLFGEDLIDELTTGLKVDEELKYKAEKILKKLDLYDYKDRHPSTLSGGQKQRLVLGVAIIHGAKVIVLDEPTSGLDGINMRRVSEVIREMNKNGRKFIVISHDIEFIINACDRLIKLDDGKIVEDYYLNSSSTLEVLKSMGY